MQRLLYLRTACVHSACKEAAENGAVVLALCSMSSWLMKIKSHRGSVRGPSDALSNSNRVEGGLKFLPVPVEIQQPSTLAAHPPGGAR